MNLKRFLLLLLTGLTIVVLAACTANESAGEEPEDDDEADTEETDDTEAVEEEDGEKVLYLNNGVEPTSLDPSIGFDEVSWDPLNNLMEGLTRLSVDHTAQPGVAEDWEISDDGLTYTFQLRSEERRVGKESTYQR